MTLTTGCAVEDCTRPGQPVICAVCRVRLTDALEALPWLVQQLDLTITRQAVIGSGGGGGEDLGFAREEADLLWVVRNTCDAWAGLLEERHGGTLVGMRYPRSSVGYSYGSGWLRARLELVLRMPELAQMVGEFVALAAACSQAVDRPADRVYCGPCDFDGRDLYAYPDADAVRCRCGAEYDVLGRRHALLDEAEDKLLPAVDISRALTAAGIEVTPDRIRQWGSRRKLLPQPGPWGGQALYRLGDARALL